MEVAFKEYDCVKFDKAFVTLQSVCNCIITSHGDNNYKIPHLGKSTMIREDGCLPASLPATQHVKEIAACIKQEELEV